jgi:hypothetical protein
MEIARNGTADMDVRARRCSILMNVSPPPGVVRMCLVGFPAAPGNPSGNVPDPRGQVIMVAARDDPRSRYVQIGQKSVDSHGVIIAVATDDENDGLREQRHAQPLPIVSCCKPCKLILY